MIRFFGEGITIKFLKHRKLFRQYLYNVLKVRNLVMGEVNYIFCNDDYLLKINQDYLHHDYYTDTITFSYSSGNTITGDIYISVDRILENSKTLNLTFQEELFRVMLHGFLHLMGYEDKANTLDQASMNQIQENLLEGFLGLIVSRETKSLS